MITNLSGSAKIDYQTLKGALYVLIIKHSKVLRTLRGLSRPPKPFVVRRTQKRLQN